MAYRGRGNFQNPGGPVRSVPAEVVVDRKTAEKKQRNDLIAQKQADKEARKAAELAAWPDIEPCYKPEVWRQKYQTDHTQMYSKSVEILQVLKGWSVEEAERTLLDILVKITFIETNLTVNGPRNAEELFDNLQLAQGDEPTIPFESPEDLAAFCDSMPLNFHRDGKRYKNTGVQGRRLVQWLKERLDQGDVIDDDSWDDMKESFCKTIQVEPHLKKFAYAEPGMDYSSLWFLAKKIPGFQYDKNSGRLSLTPEAAESLPLNVPIFTDTINSNHPRKIDYSRDVHPFMTNLYTNWALTRTEMLANDELNGVVGAFYRRTLENQPTTLDKAFMLTSGFVRPTQNTNIEVFTVEPTSFCALNNMSTKSSSSTLIAGKIAALDLNTADVSEKYHTKQIVSRLRIDKREEKKEA